MLRPAQVRTGAMAKNPSEPGSTCVQCGRRWTAPREAHCAICHQHFAGYTSFDLHLSVSRDGETVTHRDPATLLDCHGQPRLVLVERRLGPTWSRAGEHLTDWLAAS